MNRDEFTALPPSIALGILWDLAKLEDRLRDIVPPKPARSPKYDAAIYRKDGIQWASETDAEGLRFWRSRYLESAAKGGEYAAKDQKRASALDYWLAWRLVEPTTPWRGERNREVVVALPPSGKPTVYPRDGAAPSETKTEPKTVPNFDDEDDGDGEYPF